MTIGLNDNKQSNASEMKHDKIELRNAIKQRKVKTREIYNTAGTDKQS